MRYIIYGAGGIGGGIGVTYTGTATTSS